MRLGPNGTQAQLSGTTTGIGINQDSPGARLHVGGNAIIGTNLTVNRWAEIGPSGQLYDLKVDGNAEVLGHLRLDFPQLNDIAGVENDYAATTGWVRRRIAATLAADPSTRNQIASDMMNEVFQESGSALRVIQRNYCENARIQSTRSTNSYANNLNPVWDGTRCRYRIRNCSENNHCNYVYSNVDINADRDVNATQRVRGWEFIFQFSCLRSLLRKRSFIYSCR